MASISAVMYRHHYLLVWPCNLGGHLTDFTPNYTSSVAVWRWSFSCSSVFSQTEVDIIIMEGLKGPI